MNQLHRCPGPWGSARPAFAEHSTFAAAVVACSVECKSAFLPRSLELPTADFQQNVTLTALKRKRGGTAIIVQEVEPGSASAQAGVRPGQQLLGLSDTLRSGEVWELNGEFVCMAESHGLTMVCV